MKPRWSCTNRTVRLDGKMVFVVVPPMERAHNYNTPELIAYAARIVRLLNDDDAIMENILTMTALDRPEKG